MIYALAPIHGIRWMLDYANSEIPNTGRESLMKRNPYAKRKRVTLTFACDPVLKRNLSESIRRIKGDGFMAW